MGEAGYPQQAGPRCAHGREVSPPALGEEHIPALAGPLAVDAGMEVLAVGDVDRIATNPLLVLVGNLDAAVVGDPWAEEGQVFAQQAMELELPRFCPAAHVIERLAMKVCLVVVDALVNRLGPVGLPLVDVVVTVIARVEDLRGQVFLQGDRLGLPHPDVDDAAVLLGRVGFGFHFADYGCVGVVDQPCHTLAFAVEGVAVVRAGNGAGKLRFALGQPGASVGAPVEQGVDLFRFAPEEHDVFAQHLHVHGLFGAYVLFEHTGIPILPKPHGGHIVKGTDLRSSLGLAPGHLCIVGQRYPVDGVSVATVCA